MIPPYASEEEQGVGASRFDPSLTFVICWPWCLRGAVVDGLHPIGSNCLYCRRDVAQPRSLADRRPVCIYCALDRGVAAALEIPPEVSEDGSFRFGFIGRDSGSVHDSTAPSGDRP